MTPRPATGRRGRRRLLVTVTDARGRAVRAAGLGAWLASAAPASARGAVAIALISDARMRTLNRTYRGVDHATDVLSFGGAGQRAQGSRVRILGDLAIARGVAARQAASQGHSLATELRVLALHGLLHLLGYDHERDDGTMNRVEERLRRRSGLPVGLIARAARRGTPR